MAENGSSAATEETIDAATEENTEENTAENTAENTETNDETVDAANAEDVSYQAVEKEGNVTAIWEMQGRKHLRTIDPRSTEGKQILALFETAG